MGDVIPKNEEEHQEKNGETGLDESKPGIDIDRVHIQNIPKFIGFKQFKKIINKVLGDLNIKKLKHMSGYAYATFESQEDATIAIGLLNGYEIKKTPLSAHFATTEVKEHRPNTADGNNDKLLKTARESVTPLAEELYEKQLEIKQKKCEKTMERLFQQLRHNKIDGIGNGSEFRKRLQPVIPSPKTSSYRNKCEFTIGLGLEGNICIGFVGGRFSKNQHFVLKPDDVDIVSNQMKAIVKDVEDFVIKSNLKPFNEFDREGFWRLLTIREFGGDVMLVFTVFPLSNDEETSKLQKEIVARFIDESTFISKGYRVCSIFWQEMVHCSDSPNYKLIGGTPYIYESLLDCRFRVSPQAFFQTNSHAASILYSKIGEMCGLSSLNDVQHDVVVKQENEEVEAKRIKLEDNIEEEIKDNGTASLNISSGTGKIGYEGVVKQENEEVEAKKIKLEDNIEEEIEDNGTVFLDICCGTGTIGQCVLNKIYKSQKLYCIGIEMVAEAVEDAKQNAKQNKMENYCKYIAGKAEDVFHSMKYHLPIGFEMRKSRLVGVLDPPRAGMHEKVITACRELSTMKRLIFVSCEPNAAMKNIVDLCRPTSRKFAEDPFRITCIQPVDMFPQTEHVEWIIQLDR